jgi:hypothetical protein
MNRVSFWKFSTIGLLAMVLSGVSVPALSAAGSKALDQVVDLIFADTQAIKAKTAALPADPASQSAVDAKLASIQSDTAGIQAQIQNIPGPASPGKSVLTQVALNPYDGGTEKVELIAPQAGKVFYGHIVGSLFAGGGSGGYFCVQAPGWAQDLSSDQYGSPVRLVNSDFVCTELYITVNDKQDGTDAVPGQVLATTIYFETSDVTHSIQP